MKVIAFFLYTLLLGLTISSCGFGGGTLKSPTGKTVATTQAQKETAPTLNSEITISTPLITITRSGPIKYIVSFASENDAKMINPSSISLVTNDVISATISITGEGLQRKVALTSIEGEGTFHLKITISGKTFLSPKTDTITIDKTPPVIVSKDWSLISPLTGTTSNDVTPLVSAIDFNSNDEGGRVDLFDSNSCDEESMVATGIISNKNITFSDISYVEELSNKTIHFYAHVLDLAGNVSTCSDLALSYYLDIIPTPADPSEFQLLNPSNNSTSSNFTPVIAKSGLGGVSSLDSAIVSIYDNSSCENIIGSATVVSGSFTVSNMTYLSNGNDDGIKNFYGTFSRGPTHTSQCVNLGLNYKLDTRPPSIPSGWSLLTPPTGTTSGILAPQIGGSGGDLESENGTLVKIYINSSDCSNSMRGSATIVGGGFTLTNMTLANNGSEDGAVTFYAILTDMTGNSTGCTNLNLSYLLDRVIPTVILTIPLASTYIHSNNKSAFTVSGSCSIPGNNNVTITATGDITSIVNCLNNNTWTTHLDFTNVSDGNVTITANHFSTNGNVATVQSVTVIKDTTPPSPTGAITLPANNTYHAGEQINISLPINSNIAVETTGSEIPSIALTIGGVSKNASYINTTAGNTLNFRYTVESGLGDNNGITIANTLTLNGGTVRDNAGNDLSPLSFTVGNLASVFVDSMPPTFTGTAIIPANASYKEGGSLDFTLTSSRTVTVSGTPTLALNIGGTTKQASYIDADGAGGHTGTSLRFRYIVEAGLNDNNGIDSASTVILNGATIKDSSLFNLTPLSFTIGSTTGIIVDTTAPAPTGALTLPTNDTYITGEYIDFSLPLNSNVTVDTDSGTPYITMTIGATSKNASYVSASGGNILNFRYTVESGLSDTNGIAITTALNLNGATVRDLAGNNLTPLTFTVGNLTSVLVDSTPPTFIGTASIPANSFYKEGTNLDFILTTSDTVAVSGTPTIALNIGGTTKQASYIDANGAGGHTGTSLRFRYIVEAGLNDNDGIGSASVVVLSGGTIKDANTNDLTPLTFTIGSTAGVIIDITAPAPNGAITLPTNDTYLAGENIDFSLPLNSNVTVDTGSGTPYIAMTIGATSKNATYISTSSGNTLKFSYTVESGLSDTNGIAIATNLTLNGATVRDSAGNDLTPLTYTVGNLTSVLVDSTPPTFTGTASIPASASYKEGTNLDFTLTSSETVTVSGTPTIALNIGGTTKQASYIDADGAGGHTGTSLRFRYIVEAGLNDNDGIGSASVVVLSSGAIKDASTNDLTPLTFTIGSTAGIIIDTTVPAPTGAITLPTNEPYGDLYRPNLAGSGGGGVLLTPGGNGGGIIKITTTGTLNLQGTVSANGDAVASGGGGGAGGSIWIDANILNSSGTPLITTNGGGSAAASIVGGGGGRIAVYYNQSNITWGTSNVQARGGTSSSTYKAGAGTIFYKDKDSDTYGRLLLDNNSITASYATLPKIGYWEKIVNQSSVAVGANQVSLLTGYLPHDYSTGGYSIDEYTDTDALQSNYTISSNDTTHITINSSPVSDSCGTCFNYYWHMNGYADNFDAITISGSADALFFGPPTKTYITGATTASKTACTQYTITSQKNSVVPGFVFVNTIVNLSSSPNNVTFYSNSGCTLTTTTATILNGTQSIKVWVKSSATGAINIQAVDQATHLIDSDPFSINFN